MPFQFSVHVWPSSETELSHIEHLHDDSSDPRPRLIDALLNACGDKGSIVAYYGRFESDRINEMAEGFQEYAEQLKSLVARIVDPLPVIRDHVYDIGFKGSFSLKSVAPSLLGEDQSYEGMFVPNGTAAQRAFEEMISASISPERKAELSRGLLEYCHKDTLVMVELVKWLINQSQTANSNG